MATNPRNVYHDADKLVHVQSVEMQSVLQKRPGRAREGTVFATNPCGYLTVVRVGCLVSLARPSSDDSQTSGLDFGGPPLYRKKHTPLEVGLSQLGLQLCRHTVKMKSELEVAQSDAAGDSLTRKRCSDVHTNVAILP